MFGPDTVMSDRRSLEKSMARLRARCEKRPSARLAQMSDQLETELASREERRSGEAPVDPG
jgi:hypothetical protein